MHPHNTKLKQYSLRIIIWREYAKSNYRNRARIPEVVRERKSGGFFLKNVWNRYRFKSIMVDPLQINLLKSRRFRKFEISNNSYAFFRKSCLELSFYGKMDEVKNDREKHSRIRHFPGKSTWNRNGKNRRITCRSGEFPFWNDTVGKCLFPIRRSGKSKDRKGPRKWIIHGALNPSQFPGAIRISALAARPTKGGSPPRSPELEVREVNVARHYGSSASWDNPPKDRRSERDVKKRKIT